MEVVTSFRFVFIMSRPFGIFPYIPQKLTNSHVLTTSENILRQCKIVSGVFGVAKVINLIIDIMLCSTTTNRFGVAFRSVNTIIVYLLLVLACKSVLAHSDSICRWLNNINESLCSMNANCHRLNSSNNFIVLYSVAFYWAVNVTTLIYLIGNGKLINNWIATLDALMFTFALAAENLFICQFLIFVSIARLFFMSINEKFQEEAFKHQPGQIFETKLKELRILHSAATDFYDLLHTAFEFNLLFYITWAFISVLSCVVSIVLLDWNDVLTLIIWSTYHPCQIIPILCICDSVSKEAKRAGHHLEELLSEGSSPSIREEAELFSLQLQHRPTNFNVCGFFDLDYTLLHSMAAAITTYTIALLQVPSYPPPEDIGRNDNSSFV